MKLSELLAEYPDVDIEAGKDLEKAALATKEYGGTSTVDLKFKVTTAKNRVQVSVSHKAKEAQPDAEAGLWHVGPDGFTKDDPYQGRLDLDRPTNPKD